jgi:hypothetical protein
MKTTYLTLICSLILSYGLVSPAQELQKPSSTDAALSQKVGGVWLLDEDTLNGIAHVNGTINLATDGGYTIDATVKITEGPAKGTESPRSTRGKWQVKDGCLVMTEMKVRTANGTEQELPVPEVSTVRIVRVDDNELVYISQIASREKTWKRGK